MNKKVLAVGLALMLPGCANVPAPKYNPQEMVVSSAQDWRVIASDVADHLRSSLGRRVNFTGSMGKSPFETAFNNFLSTALTQRGVGVYRAYSHPSLPYDADIRYNVQTIYHGLGDTPPTSLTLIGKTGSHVWIAKTTSGLTAAVPLPSPSREIIVNVSVSREGLDVARFSQVYWMADWDGSLYAQPHADKVIAVAVPVPVPVPVVRVAPPPPPPKPPVVILNLDTLGNYPDSARRTYTPF